MRDRIIAIIIILLFLIKFIVIDPNFQSMATKDIEDFKDPDKINISKRVDKLLNTPPRGFTENCGQLENDDVRFYAQGGDLWFTDDGVWFEVRDEFSIYSQQSTVYTRGSNLATEDWRLRTSEYKRVVLKQEFVSANPVIPVGNERLSWNSNFFYGNDSSKWCTEVPNYQEIYYKNLYDGIDFRYYTNDQGLKYDFVLHPGADINQIKIRYEGARELGIDDDGNLIIKTKIQDITDGELFIYQDYSGCREQIEGRFKIYDKIDYGFELIDGYNRSEILIIDPKVMIDYSTYIGGSSGELGYDIKADKMRNAFVTGITMSSDFPTTPGAYDNSFNPNGSYVDLFILKLNFNGSKIIYSTYIGGNHSEYCQSIAIDTMGNAFVTGCTFSSDFPITPGVFDSFCNFVDIFILKLNPNGSKINYSTFIGGRGEDRSNAIAIDELGNACITGETNSTNFPITSGAFSNMFSKEFDAFVLKLNTNGSALIYSTFIGGNGHDTGEDIVLDSSGNAFISGNTGSNDFPNTTGAFNNSLNGIIDIFVLKLNQIGSNLIYSTFIGGGYAEYGESIKLDSMGNAIVTGRTSSIDFPVTLGAYNEMYNGGTCDAFVFKLNHNGSKIIYSTYIGGSYSDYGKGVVVDLGGNAIVAGYTHSNNFPTTHDALDNQYNNEESFMFKLNNDGSELLYSTYFGGSQSDAAHCIGMDPFGNVYISGFTNSTDFPTTTGVYNRNLTGSWDSFVIKFSFRKFINITSISLLMNTKPTNIIYSKYCTYTFRVRVIDTVKFWDLSNVYLTLDPTGCSIRLLWNRSSRNFFLLSDYNTYFTLEPTSNSSNNSFDEWIIDFNLTFNWSYPDEEFHDVQAYATSATLATAWLNVTDFYRVENDLVFNGTLSVKGENQRPIQKNDLVRGGEGLNWEGLITVYENTTTIYPPANEFDITLWDEAGNLWLDSPAVGKPINIETKTPSNTNSVGYSYIINLSSIPPECDATNVSFTILIDGDHVTFSNPTPDDTLWQTTADVLVSVNITDIGGGLVNGSSIKYRVRTDTGMPWGDWVAAECVNSSVTIIPQNIVSLSEGTGNLLKWQAKDSLGNGPDESEEYKIIVDTENVTFSNFIPSADYVSPTEQVKVSIIISDNTSWVDGSTIEFSISDDNGKSWTSWNSWTSVSVLENASRIVAKLNLTLQNGTENQIKWRACDVAGNGPTESRAYIVKVYVNSWLHTIHTLPKVKLMRPKNNSIIPTTFVELSWFLENRDLLNVNYSIYLDTVDPPSTIVETGYMATRILIDALSDGETYYWTVIPKVGVVDGWCDSGVWTFSVDTNIPVPSVTLISPKNGSIVSSLKPMLSWSVEYDGNKPLVYDVYLDTNDTPIEFKKSFKTYFFSQNALEDGEKYYWKIVPWAGNVRGFASETWSFTIERDHIPNFGLELMLDPTVVELTPGSMTIVKATVTNLGELKDNISLKFEDVQDNGIDAVVQEPDLMAATPGGVAKFNLTRWQQNRGDNFNGGGRLRESRPVPPIC